MFWELKSFVAGNRREFRGWRKFKNLAGMWPVYSILSDVVSTPALFVVFVYCVIRAMYTNRMLFIYLALFGSAVCCAAIWYALRRLACKLDIARAQKSAKLPFRPEQAEAALK